jgi:N-acetylmuramoyl-L-alanine amidase
VLKKLVRLRLRYVPPVLACLAIAWVAAPALSSQPYMPGAVDFEQPLGHVSASAELPAAKRVRAANRAGHGPVSFRSAAIEAPERFDAVGLAGELRPVELRARDSGGQWTEWLEVANGDPAYFGGSDEVQLRTRGWRPRGTLHYVNVSGTTSTAAGLVTGARQAINSAFISATGLFGAAAEAQPPKPTIVTRTAWGANLPKGGCPPRVSPSIGVVKAGVIHHTVTANDYSEADAPGIVLAICRYHRNANGWNDIGYQALVDRFGNLYAGRAGGVRKAVIGAHAQGFNAQTTAISSIGTHTRTAPTDAAQASIVEYLAWKLGVHRLTATGKTTLTSAGGDLSRYPAGRRVRLNKVIGHGTLGYTACPGDALAGLVVGLRRQIQARIDEYGGETPPPTPPPGGGVEPR